MQLIIFSLCLFTQAISFRIQITQQACPFENDTSPHCTARHTSMYNLEMMRVALDRYLPGRNAMLVTSLCIFITDCICDDYRNDTRSNDDNNIHRRKYNLGYSCEKEPIAKAIKMSAK